MSQVSNQDQVNAVLSVARGSGVGKSNKSKALKRKYYYAVRIDDDGELEDEDSYQDVFDNYEAYQSSSSDGYLSGYSDNYSSDAKSSSQESDSSDDEDIEIDDSSFKVHSPHGHDSLIWSQQFNHLFENIPDEDVFEERKQYKALAKLSKDFVYAAQLYGKIIISERHTPAPEKTFKPLSMGRAGGEKYMVRGILFKFSVDAFGLFGNNDHFASKIAGHELRSLTRAYSAAEEIIKCNADDTIVKGVIHFPMVCFVDYLGYRLTAVSMLPIGKKTLIYGSSDAGCVVKDCADDVEAKTTIVGIAKKLNIKPHMAGVVKGKEKELHFPVDIEVHRGTDGRLYMLDFGRIFPPEAPSGQVKILPGETLFRLLRPEFVNNYTKPLSPDAFSLFGRHDGRVHNTEVREATTYLYGVSIPEFAKFLASKHFGEVIEWFEGQKQQMQLSIGEGIVSKLHRAGCNIRHLGHIINRLEDLKSDSSGEYTTSRIEKVKAVCFGEILARVIKNEMKQQFRERMCQNKASGQPALEQDYTQLAASVLNLYFGKSARSLEWWRSKELKEKVNLYFPKTISEEEVKDQSDLRGRLGYLTAALFARTVMLTKIECSPHCKLGSIKTEQKNIKANKELDDEDFKPLVVTDIVALHPRVKVMPVLAHGEAVDLLCCLLKKKKIKEKKRLGELAHTILGPVTRSAPLDSKALFLQSQHYAYTGDVERAEKHYKFAMEASAGRNPMILCSYALYKQTKGEADTAEKLYEATLKLNKNHVRALGDYAYFCFDERKNHEKARGLFGKCLSIAPKYKQGLVDYSKFLTAMGENEKAEEYKKKALGLKGFVDLREKLCSSCSGPLDTAAIYWRTGLCKYCAKGVN